MTLNAIIDYFDLSEKKFEKLFVSTDVSLELKQSKEMLYYGNVTPTGIKFLGMDVVIDHGLPDGRWYLK